MPGFDPSRQFLWLILRRDKNESEGEITRQINVLVNYTLIWSPVPSFYLKCKLLSVHHQVSRGIYSPQTHLMLLNWELWPDNLVIPVCLYGIRFSWYVECFSWHFKFLIYFLPRNRTILVSFWRRDYIYNTKCIFSVICHNVIFNRNITRNKFIFVWCKYVLLWSGE